MGCLADDWAALETEAALTDQVDQRHKAYDYRGSEIHTIIQSHFNAAYRPKRTFTTKHGTTAEMKTDRIGQRKVAPVQVTKSPASG